MSTGAHADTVESARGDAAAPLDSKVATSEDRALPSEKEQGILAGDQSDIAAEEVLRGPNGEEYPTARELETLRRVKGRINWIIYTIAFIELCERFAYYGTTQVCT